MSMIHKKFLANRIANELLDLRARKANIGRLSKLYKIAVGKDIGLSQNMTMREFRAARAELIDSYLNRVHDAKTSLLKNPADSGYIRFNLLNYYCEIRKALEMK